MYSMTGYGRGTASLDGRELTIELKSVNNRFLDIGMKLPRQLSFLEDGLRKLLNDALSRGHVDVFVNYASDVALPASDYRQLIVLMVGCMALYS